MLILALAMLVIGAMFMTRRAKRGDRQFDNVRKVAGSVVLLCGVVVFIGEIV